MKSLNESITEYKKQLEKGDVKTAYRGLMEYIMALRVHFEHNHPEYNVSGSIYQGYMDMSFFSITTDVLKEKKLRIAVVFLHEAVCFEAWLVGNNRKIQSDYMKLLNDMNFDKYLISSPAPGVDSILECKLTDSPDFNNLSGLTSKIQNVTLKFIKDIEALFK
ncbi:MAG: hypothetical protein JXB49_37690 [Bacteroidales bacterium]|nr:hypothetical protein [Bacteroidales bacterium]